MICDKPVTLDLEQARELRKIINKSKKVFALTHNYTGYPMVKLARQMIRKGELGELIKVVCEYPAGLCHHSPHGGRQGHCQLAGQPEDCGNFELHGRYRNSCRESGTLYHWLGN